MDATFKCTLILEVPNLSLSCLFASVWGRTPDSSPVREVILRKSRAEIVEETALSALQSFCEKLAAHCSL